MQQYYSSIKSCLLMYIFCTKYQKLDRRGQFLTHTPSNFYFLYMWYKSRKSLIMKIYICLITLVSSNCIWNVCLHKKWQQIYTYIGDISCNEQIARKFSNFAKLYSLPDLLCCKDHHRR